MSEEKHRNGLISIRYRPIMEQNRLSRIGWFKLGNNGESIIYHTKPDNTVYPLYLEIRSHRVFSEFIGHEVEFQGYLTLNRIDGKIRSAHVTPVNLPLLGLLLERIIYQQGQLSIVEMLTNKT